MDAPLDIGVLYPSALGEPFKLDRAIRSSGRVLGLKVGVSFIVC